MKVPDFFLVGAAKAGTTSIFKYLIQHPSIFIPDIKEPHFFSDYPQPRAPRFDGVNDYLALFRECPADSLAGDASTSYLCSPRAAGRIYALNPRARILMVLRNPVDRAYSMYWYNRRDFAENLTFEEALEAEPQRLREATPFRYHYVTSGNYTDQVARFLDVFGRDAVRVYLYEELQQNPKSLCRDIFTFLGVGPEVEVDTEKIFNPGGPSRNKFLAWALSSALPGRDLIRRVFPRVSRRAKYLVMLMNVKRPPPMSPTIRARLCEEFLRDIERLEQLIGRDLSAWKVSDSTQEARGDS